jgi:hypothetical protein
MRSCASTSADPTWSCKKWHLYVSQCASWYSCMNILLIDRDGAFAANHPGRRDPELASEAPARIGVIAGAS